jgi:hypothetical protein
MGGDEAAASGFNHGHTSKKSVVTLDKGGRIEGRREDNDDKTTASKMSQFGL